MFASAVRALDDELLEEPLLGVEKRFRAVASEDPPAAAPEPVDDAPGEEPVEACPPAELEEDEEEASACAVPDEPDELDDDDEELPEADG